MLPSKFLVAALGLPLSASLLANSYQYEISGSVDHYHSDRRAGSDYSHVVSARYDLTGTYHFTPVATQNHPLAQAAFLERSDNLSLNYAYSDDQTIDKNSIAVSRDYYHSEQQDLTAMVRLWSFDKWLYTSFGLTDSHYDFHAHRHVNGVEIESVEGHGHTDPRWQASLGVSPFAGLLVYTNIYEDVDVSDYINLNVQYFHALGDQSVATHVRYSDTDFQTNIHLDVDYYFTRHLSLGASYEHADEFTMDYDWALRGQYFFSNTSSVKVQYQAYDDSDHAMVLGLNTRF